MFFLCDNARLRDLSLTIFFQLLKRVNIKTFSTRFSTFCTATSYNTIDPYIAGSAQYCRVSKNLKKMGFLLPSYIKNKIFPTHVL